MTTKREAFLWLIITILNFRIITHESHLLISMILQWLAIILMAVVIVWMFRAMRNEQEK